MVKDHEKYVWPDLSESILQRTDRLAGGVSREADLLPFLKGPGRDSVEVSVANPTSQAGMVWEKINVENPNNNLKIFHSNTLRLAWFQTSELPPTSLSFSAIQNRPGVVLTDGFFAQLELTNQSFVGGLRMGI